MKEKTRKFYLKPSTEVFFVEDVQLMAGTIGGTHKPSQPGDGGQPGDPIIEQEDAKEFFGFGNDGDFESEKIFSTETSWDD